MIWLKHNLWWIGGILAAALEFYVLLRWTLVGIAILVVLAGIGAVIVHRAMQPPVDEPTERQAPHDD